MAIFVIAGNIFAEDKLYVSDVQIPEGGSANAQVSLLSSSERSYVAFQFDLQLPAGISIADVDNDAVAAKRLTDVTKNWSIAVKQIDVENNIYNVLVYNATNAAIEGEDGVVLNIKLTADASLKEGVELADGIITNAIISEKTEKHSSAEGTFKIEIVAPLVLDENSTVEPEATAGVENFKVIRSVKAGKWNTICFPFELSNAQLKEIFGSDVELASLAGNSQKKTSPLCYEITAWDADDNITAIDVKFETIDLSDEENIFEANTPYIIKTSKDITEFSVKAQIAPEDPIIEDTNGQTSASRKIIYGQFVGTYVANTVVPENGLFISDNKFWYSTGQTKMKAFRAYINLYENLASLEGNAKISFVVDGDPTSIDGIGYQHVVDGVYDLSGRKIQLEDGDLNKLQKGVYIIDGKKVTIK